MRSLARILSRASALWPYYIGVILASVTTAALALVTPFIIRQATDTIVAAVGGKTDVNHATHTILWLAGALLAAELANTLMTNLGGYVGDLMAARMRQILSTRYFAKLLSLPQAYFDNQVTGTIIARLDRSISTIAEFLKGFANNFFPMLLTVFAVLAITSWYYWPLALLLGIVFPIYMWLTALTSKKWQKMEGSKNHQIDLAGGRFAEVVGQVKAVKSFVAEVRELGGFGRRYGETVRITRGQSRYWHLMDIARSASMNLIFFCIYMVLFYRTLHGHFSLGDMVMLIQLVTMARTPVFMMSYLVDTAQRAIAGSKDYFEVMEQQPEPTTNPEILRATEASDVPSLTEFPTRPLRLAPRPDTPVLDFDGVTFTYPGDEAPVLHDVRFTAARGQKIALVSESGGGKTTLVNLLLGLYRPERGTVRVGGHEVSEVDAAELRATIGVVFQDASLFSGKIRENIAYGRPSASEAEIIEAAKRANAHGFISDFPDGYDTVIGERGLRLSGGQKQRVAVARAMLKDAPVLVLDEATSALDTKSERAVQLGLEELMAGRTTLIIAHRLSTIASVDTIVTLRQGQVDEIGSPAELARSGGIYAELLQLTASASEADRERLKRFGVTGH